MKSPLVKITVFILLFAAAGAVSQSLIATDSAKLAGVTPSAAGLALLDDSDATAQRTTLALGSGNDVTFNSVTIADAAYDSAWNGELKAPTRNALYDKIQTLQPLDGDLTALAELTDTGKFFYRSAANTWSPVVIGSNLSFSGGTLSGTPHTFVRDIGFTGFSPGANMTYYAGTTLSSWSIANTPDLRRTYIPSNCTITKIYGWFSVAGAAGSNETSSLYVRKNNTGTDTLVASSIVMTTLTPQPFNATGLRASNKMI